MLIARIAASLPVRVPTVVPLLQTSFVLSASRHPPCPSLRLLSLFPNISFHMLSSCPCRAHQFPRLRAERNHFMDTIKLIAYRAETALVGTVREALARRDDARALLREIMCTTADLRPDAAQKTLTVHLYPLGSALQNAAVHALAAELTATETIFPGTDLRLIFTLSGPA